MWQTFKKNDVLFVINERETVVLITSPSFILSTIINTILAKFGICNLKQMHDFKQGMQLKIPFNFRKTIFGTKMWAQVSTPENWHSTAFRCFSELDIIYSACMGRHIGRAWWAVAHPKVWEVFVLPRKKVWPNCLSGLSLVGKAL
jgi:hypothetical protein